MSRFLINYEIRQIQKYIYNSSKIKEIVGASNLVRDCLIDFLIEACDDLKINLKHNIKEEYENIGSPFKFNDALDFQIAYEGGGNLSCFVKGNEEKVKLLNRKVGLLFLEKTYSLRVCYGYIEISDNFLNDRKKLSEKMNELKVKMPMSHLQGTLPIIMSSNESSLPLSEKSIYGNNRKITKESKIKLDKYSMSADNNYGTTVLDDLIEKDVNSYIAIVHIDANDLGVAISKFFQSKLDNNSPRNYEEMVSLSRDVSNKIKTKYNDYFAKYLKEYVDTLKDDKFAYRIIVNSGDDITFIFPSEFAIEFVAGFLTNINNESFFDNDIKISACAGIAFVKSHFPYNRGYEIAEELCESSKKKAKSKEIRQNNNNQSRCAFDYYICQNGIITTVAEDEEKFKHLYCKPYIVNRNNSADDDYETLLRRIKELSDESNRMSYGKAKQIRNAYEKGNISLLIKKISSKLNKPLEEAFINKKAIYYDASTLIDFSIMTKEMNKI